ncbi:MAG: ATP synthase F1 subunit epsilon [Clostridiales bacterium]|nr:ATP synthase F1 subunit epsilon [Clostridiales bacterium]
MAEKFQLQVITPERIFYEGETSFVEMNTTEGEVGIYKNHIPMTMLIAPGVLMIHEDGGVKEAALHSGFVEVLPDRVAIVAEIAEWPEEIDMNRANEAKIRAERRLKNGEQTTNIMRAEVSLKRALTRLEVGKHR